MIIRGSQKRIEGIKFIIKELIEPCFFTLEDLKGELKDNIAAIGIININPRRISKEN
jgi:hypothetical protein